MKLTFGLILIFLGCINAIAQDEWLSYPAKNDTDTVVTYQIKFNQNGGELKVYKDDRLDKIEEFVRADEGTVDGVKMDGYRVLIYFNQDKSLSEQQKAKFIRLYPEHKAYLDYMAPNYRVRVGNFRTKLEAEALKAEILEIFPTAIVIEDKIQLPEIPVEGDNGE